MNPTPQSPAPWRDTCARLLRSAGSQAARLRASLVLLLLAAVLQGLALACIAPLFQRIAQGAPLAGSAGWLLAFTALGLASTALRWRAQGFDYHGHMARATHELRVRLGEQLRRMPLLALQERRAGEVASQLLGSVDEQMNYVVTVVNLILSAIVTPAVAALALMAADWRLGLALLLVFPALVPLYRWRRPALDRGMRQAAQANEALSADLLEHLQGLPVCLATGSAGAARQRLLARVAEVEAVQHRAHRQGAKPTLWIALAVEAALLALLGVGALWVTQGSLDPALLAAALVLVVRFAEPLATFVTYTAIFALIEAALARIDTLLAEPPLPQWPRQAPPPGPAPIEVDAVCFQYPDAAAPALRDLDLVLPAPGLTALVGPSGSGKTTLTRLLMRHADPQAGAIRIGGVDLRALDPADHHRLIATVFQEVHLFDDTVLGNIRMARPDADEAAVVAAARAAQCLPFIERLPQGWHTRLGEAGGRLSGGERQRLSIARALLKDAPIVILDEPTAALDTENERAVQAAIDRLVQDRCVIVIAHRLSTIVAADRILVLDQGRLVQSGRHEALLAQPGRYRALWLAQQGMAPSSPAPSFPIIPASPASLTAADAVLMRHNTQP